MRRCLGVVGFAVVALHAGACKPTDLGASRQAVTAPDGGTPGPSDGGGGVDALALNPQTTSYVLDPPQHGKLTDTEKKISPDRLLAQFLHLYSKGATSISHVVATNVSYRLVSGTPSNTFTDFDLAVVELLRGDPPPTARQTVPGGTYNGITEIDEHAPSVNASLHYIAFFKLKKGVWYQLGLIPAAPNGDVLLFGRTLSTTELMAIVGQ